MRGVGGNYRSFATRLSRACSRTFSCSASRASVHPTATLLSTLLLLPTPVSRKCASGGQTSPERRNASPERRNVAGLATAGVFVPEARIASRNFGARGGGDSRLVFREKAGREGCVMEEGAA